MSFTYVMLFLSLLFEIVADYFFKTWSMTDRLSSLVLGVVGYAVATVFFAFSLKNESMVKMVSLFTVTNCVAATLIGLWFGDPFPLRIQLGVGCALVAVWLLG